MCDSLDLIRNSAKLSLTEKLEFFAESRHAYGKTAILLSGGAQNGLYHTGVLKVLYEQNLLPRIICGSSAGAITASMIATHTLKEIPRLFECDYLKGELLEPWDWASIKKKAKRFLTKGVFLENSKMKEFTQGTYGDITF